MHHTAGQLASVIASKGYAALAKHKRCTTRPLTSQVSSACATTKLSNDEYANHHGLDQRHLNGCAWCPRCRLWSLAMDHGQIQAKALGAGRCPTRGNRTTDCQ